MSLPRTPVKWTDRMRDRLLKEYKQRLDTLGEEEFFRQFEEIRIECHKIVEASNRENIYPSFEGEALSWSLDLYNTPRETEDNYPRMRVVIRAMKEHQPDRLFNEYRELIKDSLGKVFGHAKPIIKVIKEEAPELVQRYEEWISTPVPFYIDPVHSAASTLGRLGGQAKSPDKSTSSRENGRKGGRPKKVVTTETIDDANLDLFQ